MDLGGAQGKRKTCYAEADPTNDIEGHDAAYSSRSSPRSGSTRTSGRRAFTVKDNPPECSRLRYAAELATPSSPRRCPP
jgi:hypothetical protein